MKLYDETSIEIWKNIADRVQKLNITSYDNDEFNSNLKILHNLLLDLNYTIKEGKKDPIIENQIGLSSLLSSIYKISIISKNFTQDFCEYIYTLDDLGVQTIQYKPINFPLKNKTKLEYYDDYTHMQKIITKCYTDGKFKISKPDAISYRDYSRYLITDIKDASYLLNTSICHEAPYGINKPYVLKSNIIIKNFNGALPSKEELLNTEFPKLRIHSKKINWGESPEYSQIFNEYINEDIIVKKLKK